MSMFNTDVPFEDATGKVQCNMTNDCLFHVVLQKDLFALKGLIAALLHIPPETIKSIRIQNPILFGENYLEKQFVLDMLVFFNDNTYIDLEMQVYDEKNWVPRSMSYLCREFCNLNHGEDYSQVRAAYHVGFLDFTLFDDHPEFYATYRMRNIHDGYEYTDNFTLSVVELKHISLATEEDKLYKIDQWARLFKATTWEEVKMAAQENPYIESAARSIYANVKDPVILSLCMKRQEDLDGEEHRRQRIIEQDQQIAEQNKQIAEQDKRIAEMNKQLIEKNQQIERLEKQSNNVATLEAELAALKAKIL